jgi:purine catabolism regulator
MALTVNDLAHDASLGLLLRVEGSPEAMSREIFWSHPTELINPQMFSQSNEIIVTSGGMIPRRTRANARAVDEAARVFIDNITSAHVCALAFGTRLLHKTIPQVLLDYARSRNLPVLEIPIEVPFSLVMNAVAHGVESQAGTQLRQAYSNMRNLVQAASSQDPIREMTLNLATGIGGWCVLLTPYGSVAESSHLSARNRAFAAMAASSGGNQHPASTRVEGEHVRILPLRSADGTGLGTLVTGSRMEATEFDETLIAFAVNLFRLALFRRHGQDETLHQMRSIMMRKVFDGDGAMLRDFARPLWDCDMPREPLRAIAVHGSQQELSSIAAEISPIRRSGSELTDRIFGQLDSSLWIITSAQAYRRMTKALSGKYQVAIGISGACDWHGVREAQRQALVAASRAEAAPTAHVSHLAHASLSTSFTGSTGSTGENDGDASHGRIVCFDEIAQPQAPNSVISAIDADAAHAMAIALDQRSDELCHTILVWLAQLCNNDRAAKLLGIHRHTLAKRLDDAEQALGRSLNDPQTRAELWLALNAEYAKQVDSTPSTR